MENLQNTINELKKIVENYDNIVFFGGAGVSTESGIPDFRSVDGLYHQQYDYPPETILSHTFYRHYGEEFYRFYRNKMLFPDAKPNTAHLKLAELEQTGKVRAVITQNIDGLHQLAGSKKIDVECLVMFFEIPEIPSAVNPDGLFLRQINVWKKDLCVHFHAIDHLTDHGLPILHRPPPLLCARLPA